LHNASLFLGSPVTDDVSDFEFHDQKLSGQGSSGANEKRRHVSGRLRGGGQWHSIISRLTLVAYTPEPSREQW
jgi:hypothetical protein